jgi:hypothetical protein
LNEQPDSTATPPATDERPEDERPDDERPEGKKKKKKKLKEFGAGRGVETMFRTAYRTHLDLSSLADRKANIMISINGLMIGILVSTIYPSIAANQRLLLPASVLVLGCLGSIVYAVLAARPRVTHRKVVLSDIRANKANILFFGTFVNMSEDDFLAGMWELMNDRERTYTNMMRDLYGLGSVLETKYRLLRISYTIFIIGLVVGVGLFLGAYATVGA